MYQTGYENNWSGDTKVTTWKLSQDGVVTEIQSTFNTQTDVHEVKCGDDRVERTGEFNSSLPPLVLKDQMYAVSVGNQKFVLMVNGQSFHRLPV